MDLYDQSIPRFTKFLKNLDTWLDHGVEHATEKKFDPELLLGLRLTPNQYPLIRQIQSACDSAKLGVARLVGKEAPAHPDTETTLEQIRARIKVVIEYISGFTREDFRGADDRKIAPAFLQGKWLTADAYLTDFVTPNFFFHVTTAYSILRANGVELGKKYFIADLPLND